MKSSSELLLNWGSKVMKSDEGFSNNVDKQMLNQLVNENVISLNPMNLKKAAILKLFFLIPTNKLLTLILIHLLKF